EGAEHAKNNVTFGRVLTAGDATVDEEADLTGRNRSWLAERERRRRALELVALPGLGPRRRRPRLGVVIVSIVIITGDGRGRRALRWCRGLRQRLPAARTAEKKRDDEQRR